MTHTEGAITDLPRKRFLICKIAMNPTRRIRLQLTHQIGQRMFCRQRRENVDVVCRAIDDERFAVMRADDAAEIRKQARFKVRVEQWPPVLRAENNVRQQMGERVRHKINCRTGFVSATEWRAIVAHGETVGTNGQMIQAPDGAGEMGG